MSPEREQEHHDSAETLTYSAVPGSFDEMEEAPATPRPHWRPLFRALQRLGRRELVSRSHDGRRLIREHGVTYNTYGDPHGTERPWGLDLVPLLITAEEWARLEAGLIQRLRLFNLILADLYGGAQHLLRDGFLPPQLLYANPTFLRPCRGIPIRSQVYVHFHACDLGRSADGQWSVLSDRTQAPSGAGYAWENRTVVSRLLPEEIRAYNVQSVGSFFRQQREMLFRLAPPRTHSPSVVLLTPGPYSNAYFEHAYLARHLGFPLVEGADLLVRGRQVFLKTIEGLQPVDVILRRVDDSFCDPLELQDDSFVGAAGLLDATRAGAVTVANAIGAGLLESPAFVPFYPNLCRRLLGEELLLPSISTRWCGEAESLRYTSSHLDSLVLKPAFGRGISPAGTTDYTTRRRVGHEQAQLRESLSTAPHEVVAQERIRLSQAPAWVDGQLRPRSVVVRAFVAYDGERMAVLPGGLTRVSDPTAELVLSVQTDSGSKDTWILANGLPDRREPPTQITEPHPAEQAPWGVPSRAADHLFWLGRYTERLEQLLRVLRCVLGRVSDEPGGERSIDRKALVELAFHLGLLPEPAQINGNSRVLSDAMLHLVYDSDQKGGVRELVGQIRMTASAVRDRFSGDTWRILGRLDLDARRQPGRLPIAGATALLHELVLDLAAFNGMAMENMTRGRGWRFLDLGRRLERGLCVVKLLEAALSVRAPAAVVLDPVLEIADCVMTYRRMYFDRPHLSAVFALVGADESNPRSLAFQLKTLAEHASALTNDTQTAADEPELGQIAALRQAVQRGSLTESAAPADFEKTTRLVELLRQWAAELAAISDRVTNRYFSHSVPRPS
jgi:uncharacterized circularly permuted ATP-grasp superfamily protein/uncharacterized alpha-E superfamily protein